jgi:hypothetical protein
MQSCYTLKAVTWEIVMDEPRIGLFEHAYPTPTFTPCQES